MFFISHLLPKLPNTGTQNHHQNHHHQHNQNLELDLKLIKSNRSYSYSSDEESNIGFPQQPQPQPSSSLSHWFNPFLHFCSRFIYAIMLINLGIFILITIIGLKTNNFSTFWIDYLSLSQTSQDIKAMNLNNLMNYKLQMDSISKLYPIHSHNDYWRSTPLFDALNHGISSVEADVWYLPYLETDELFVGHKKIVLSQYKTLDSLYLSNIESLLDDLNTYSQNDTLKGVFSKDPSKTLDLIIDIKTDAYETYKQIQTQIQSLISKQYLTYFNEITQTWYHGPVTIHISGNIPYELIKSQEIRYTFIDANLEDPEFQAHYNDKNSIISSSSLARLTGSKRGMDPKTHGLSSMQKQVLGDTFQMAHEMGIKTRVWDTPKHSAKVRDQIWLELLELGVDSLNADDLSGAVEVMRRE